MNISKTLGKFFGRSKRNKDRPIDDVKKNVSSIEQKELSVQNSEEQWVEINLREEDSKSEPILLKTIDIKVDYINPPSSLISVGQSKELKDSEIEVKDSKREIKDLEEKDSKNEVEVKDLEGEVKDSGNVEDLGVEVKDLKVGVKDSKEKIKELEGNVEDLEEVLEGEDDDLHVESKDLKGKIKDLRGEVKDSKEEIKDLEGEVEVLEREDKDLKVESKDLKEEIKGLKEVEDSKGEIKVLEGGVKDSGLKVKDLQGKYKVSEEEVKDLQRESKVSEDKVKDSEREIKDSGLEVKDLQGESKVSEEEVKHSDREVKDPAGEVRSSKNILDELKELPQKYQEETFEELSIDYGEGDMLNYEDKNVEGDILKTKVKETDGDKQYSEGKKIMVGDMLNHVDKNMDDESLKCEDKNVKRDVEYERTDINERELKRNICSLLEAYLNNNEKRKVWKTNVDKITASILDVIDSFTDASSTVQSESNETNNAELCEASEQLCGSSKKVIDDEYTSSMTFLLSQEFRSISFNLDKHAEAESVLSVINAIQAEFLRMKVIPNDGSGKSRSISEFNERSESKIQSCEMSRSSVASSKRLLLSDGEILCRLFEYVQDKVSTMIAQEKETMILLGQLTLDMQQLGSLVDLLRQWANHKLDKLSNSIEKLKNYVSSLLTPVNTRELPQRRIKIVLIRQSDPALM